MSVENMAFVQGMAATRTTLTRWNAAPWPVLRVWLRWSIVVAFALLGATWVIGLMSTPDPSGTTLPGVNSPATMGAVAGVLGHNSLVLALHSFACLAGFIAGSSLPLQAQARN